MLFDSEDSESIQILELGPREWGEIAKSVTLQKLGFRKLLSNFNKHENFKRINVFGGKFYLGIVL